ncbi:hypothetical protein ABW20_dc0101195 [Dactylellina cionopaga]|nr:hypothetical protein ABW20_dc0101195 [Dactylellina cionopaga]
MSRPSNNTNGASSGFSISLGSKKSAAGSTATSKAPISRLSAFSRPGNKRGPALSDDDEDGHDDDDDHRDKIQLVTGFGSRGAITVDGEQEAKTLVIPSLKNKDWRAESRRKKGIYLPPEATAKRDGISVDTRDVIGDEPIKVGLQFVEKSTAGMKISDGDLAMLDAAGESNTTQQAGKVEKTEDQLAMEALLAGDKAKASTLTIPAVAGNVADEQGFLQNEDDAYRADVASRPEAATLEEYAAVPVEEFGAALLRGMGWKEGEAIGRSGSASKPRVVERRAAFLGIGAKGIGAEEIGAWGKGDKKKRQRVDKTYLPITLVDKNGKRIEEDESKDLVKKDVDKDWRKRDDKDRSDRKDRDRDSYDDKDDSRSKRDRERDRIDERDRDRRDRDRDRDGYRDRSRDRKDRDRHKEKDSSRGFDRKHRSSDYDDRDRDRDRRRRRSHSRERSRR